MSIRYKIKKNENGEDIGFPLTRADEGSAGWDLRSIDGFELKPKAQAIVPTCVFVELPENTYGRIAPRSGLASRGVDVLAGVVDRSYRGQIKVILINLGTTTLIFERGDRIAQLIVTPYVSTPMVRTEEELSETDRGEGGFGSSGMK